jgi:hypothetical protein
MGSVSRTGAFGCLFAGLFSVGMTVPQIDYSLAISLQPNWQEPITYATLGIHKGKIVSTDFLSSHEFILVASGHLQNKANPSKVNLFEAFQIANCEVEYDAPFRSYWVDCPMIDRLWKLRYRVKPGETKKESTVIEGDCSNCGWARHDSAPDSVQVAMLKEFGLHHLSDWIVGEQVFNLLKATSNSAFISRYQSP